MTASFTIVNQLHVLLDTVVFTDVTAWITLHFDSAVQKFLTHAFFALALLDG